MGGISAVIDRRGRPIDPQLIAEMNRRVIHRGPDDEGVFAHGNFALGHRRLSIVDLSPTGRQPRAYAEHLVVTYDGEIYNHPELRAELTRHGYRFDTSSDAEVLLAAYDRWGEDCVRRFNGMWAFVLWDKRRNVLFCSRDRFGVKPLHYVELPAFFALGSEVKQFVGVPGFVARVDEVAAYRFLVEGRLSLDARGFFSGVRELRGGHNLIYDLGNARVTIRRWYDLAAASSVCPLPFREAGEHFKQLFFDAVRLRLRADVAVGSCLSGGVDSAALVAAMHALSGASGSLRTIGVSFDDADAEQAAAFDAVARATGVPAIVIHPSVDDLLARGTLDRMIYHQDQPISSAAHFAQYGVFEAARAHRLLVMLDVRGADEYLAGSSDFFPVFIRGQLARSHYLSALHEMRDRGRRLGWSLPTSLRTLFSAAASGSPWPGGAGRRSSRAPSWLGPTLARLAGDSVLRVPEQQQRGSIRELSIAQITSTRVPYQLHSEDRHSMLHSVEARLPFLDHRLVEFGVSLPDEYKIRDGATKAIVHEGLRGVLPETLVLRNAELGLAAHEQSWMRRNAEGLRRELSSVVAAFPQLLRESVITRFDASLTGHGEYNPAFFRVIAFGRWARLFNVAA